MHPSGALVPNSGLPRSLKPSEHFATRQSSKAHFGDYCSVWDCFLMASSLELRAACVGSTTTFLAPFLKTVAVPRESITYQCERWCQKGYWQ